MSTAALRKEEVEECVRVRIRDSIRNGVKVRVRVRVRYIFYEI